jgi:hypothetical protein
MKEITMTNAVNRRGMLAPALASVAFLPACGLDDGGSTSVGVPRDPTEDFPANPAAASGSDTQKSH